MSLEDMIDQAVAGSTDAGIQLTIRPEGATVHWFAPGGMLRKASGPTITLALETALAEQGR